jgi:hypothetical protein
MRDSRCVGRRNAIAIDVWIGKHPLAFKCGERTHKLSDLPVYMQRIISTRAGNGGEKKLMIVLVVRPRASADLCADIVFKLSKKSRIWREEIDHLATKTCSSTERMTHCSRHSGRRLEHFVPPDRRGNTIKPYLNKLVATGTRTYYERLKYIIITRDSRSTAAVRLYVGTGANRRMSMRSSVLAQTPKAESGAVMQSTRTQFGRRRHRLYRFGIVF